MRITNKDTKLNLKIVNLNNKSRQGTYIYIKREKKRGSYYKYQDEDINLFLEYYNNRIVKKDKTITLQKYKKIWKGETIKEKEISQKLQRIKTRTSKGILIKDALKTGSFNEKISLFNTNMISIRQKVEDLISKATTNEKTKQLILNNINKINNRLSYEVTIRGINEQGDYTTLAKFNDINNRNPYDMVQKYKDLFKDGDNISSKVWKEKVNFLNKFNTNKINPESTKRYNGIIQNIEINMKLVKGK